jgi:hypothetical protein
MISMVEKELRSDLGVNIYVLNDKFRYICAKNEMKSTKKV